MGSEKQDRQPTFLAGGGQFGSAPTNEVFLGSERKPSYREWGIGPPTADHRRQLQAIRAFALKDAWELPIGGFGWLGEPVRSAARLRRGQVERGFEQAARREHVLAREDSCALGASRG